MGIFKRVEFTATNSKGTSLRLRSHAWNSREATWKTLERILGRLHGILGVTPGSEIFRDGIRPNSISNYGDDGNIVCENQLGERQGDSK